MDEREKILVRFLEAKRDSVPASPGFEGKVMDAIVAAQGRAGAGRRRSGEIPVLARLLGALRQLGAGPGSRILWATACLALMAGAYWTFAPGAGMRGASDTETPEGIRLKGGAYRFGLVLEAGGDGLRRVEDGESLRSGDRIQPLYWMGDSGYLVLLSVDGRGKTQCYSCAAPGVKLPPGSGLPLPFALELDAAPGLELFVLAASRDPMPTRSLRSELEEAWSAAKGDLPKTREILERAESGARFRTFLVRKGERT